MCPLFQENSDLFYEKKKKLICKENRICFYVKERIRFLLKIIRFVLCRVKKGDFIKKNQFFFFFFNVNEIRERLFERGSTFMR